MPDNFAFWLRSRPALDLAVKFPPEGWTITFQSVVVDTLFYFRYMRVGRRVGCVVLHYRQTLTFTWHLEYGGLLTYTMELLVDIVTPTVAAIVPTDEHFYVFAPHVYKSAVGGALVALHRCAIPNRGPNNNTHHSPLA
ncbi:hypothetical protein CLCR_03178 [Cladophialophora carrionii]|uniref:Uncharacterized protein n=1 Tax=Cladophialophora carrionii TaxID=86049 RepID=A0A1C1D2P0_9EURO|nr:hypothetical protein CLCR_03178 [Cladophialophora carrionii]